MTLHRDQLVLEVPFMRLGDHAIDGIAAELLADHLQLVVEAGVAHGDLGSAFLHQLDKTRARGLRVAGPGQRHHRGSISPR
jgi:hypothetical protein